MATSKKSSKAETKTSSSSAKTVSASASKKFSTQKKPSQRKSNSKRKNGKTKQSKFWLILLIVLIALVVAIYFLRPDIFYAGKNAVLNFLEPERTEQVVQTESETSSQPQEASQTQNDAAKNAQTQSQNETSQSSEENVSKSGKSVSKPDVPCQAKPLTAENLPLYFGNPSGATTEIKNAANYLMEKKQFSMSYNNEKLIPNWVMWHLEKTDMGSVDRGDDFRPDDELPENFYGVKKADYQYSQFGFDRGHVCPSADRTATQTDNSMTFLMTNMMPQSPNCNRNVWKNLEAYERELALSGNELYIAAGPYGKGGTSDKGTFDEIPLKNGQAIEVPSYCWKIIMILPEGENDFNRVNDSTKILAAWIPNNQAVSEHTWDYYLTTVDFIEEQTENDFFYLLENEIEDVIEAVKYSYEK